MTESFSSGLPPTIKAAGSESTTAPCREVHCWVSFGGNVGEVKATFDAALALLSLHSEIQLGPRSGLYCSTPMGTQAGQRFLNSICGLTTRLPAYELLSVLQSVETQLGRVRKIDWGPRTLDLDLLSYGDLVFDEPQLVVPHPALTYRRFVLDPLVEVDPHWRHPVFAESMEQMLCRLKRRPLKVALLNVAKEEIFDFSVALESRFPDVELIEESEIAENILPVEMSPPHSACEHKSVDLRRSPGDPLEQLTAALTAIFDCPKRISDW